MADQLDSNPRAPNPEQDGDDPLAELARIIGYERPAEIDTPVQPESEIEASAFDLEAELMRELDVLPADGDVDVPEPTAQFVASSEADETMDHTISGPALDAGSDLLTGETTGSGPIADDVFEADVSWLDNKPDDTGAEYGAGDAGSEPDAHALEFELFGDADDSSADDATAPDMEASGQGEYEAGAELWESPELDAAWEAPTPLPDDGRTTDGPDDNRADELGQVIPSGVGLAGALQTDRADMPDAAPAQPGADAPDFSQTAQNAAPVDQPVGTASASGPDMSDDDVLADMFRFDLPEHTSVSAPAPDRERTSGLTPEAPVALEPTDGPGTTFDDIAASAGLAAGPETDTDPFAESNGVSDFADAFEQIDSGPFDATVSDDAFAAETDTAPSEDVRGTDAVGSIDFEDYLSAELDVFEHEVAIAPREAVRDQAETGDTDDPGPRSMPVSGVDADPFGTGLDNGEGAFDDAETVFDEAAEELLADIEQDEIITQAGEVEPEDAGAVDLEAEPGPVSDPWAESPTDDATDDDMRALPAEEFANFDADEADSADGPDVTSDLELALEQVLAETVIDEPLDAEVAVATGAEAGVEPDPLPETAEEAVQHALEVADEQAPELIAEIGAAPDHEHSALADTEQDELAQAFVGLVPEEDAQPRTEEADVAEMPEETGAPHTSAVAVATAVDQADDWLAGFDTSNESGKDEDAFFFDASMIAEPEEPVQPVADIDVPDLADHEPRPEPSGYDADIEREFADIIDLDAPHSMAGANGYGADGQSAAGADGHGLGDDWSRTGTDARDFEASDDYIALERELGVDDVHVAPPYRDADGDAQDADPMDGAYATGLAVEERPERDSRGPVVALAVLGLALLAGAGAFGWSMLSGGDTASGDGPRIIRADKEPVKVLPENPGGLTVPNQDKAVYDRVAGGDSTETGQPALVNTAEEPVDVVQRTLDPDVLPLEGRDAAGAVKSEERLAADANAAAAPGSNTAPAPVVSPRRVRTMIVKPDGSIVAREEPAAAPDETVVAAAPPVASEPAPEVAAQTPAEPVVTPSPDPLVSSAASVTDEAASDAQAPATDSVAATSAEAVAPAPVPAPAQAPAPADTAATEGTVAPVRVVTTRPIRAPIPQGRPADQPVNVVSTVTQGGNVSNGQQAPAQPAQPAQPAEVAAAPAAAAPAPNPGGYYVQIASQPTAEGAQASWRTLSNRFSSVLGGRSVDIRRADIPGKGVFHRVRVPAGSRDQANALCRRYKSAGGSCFVSR